MQNSQYAKIISESQVAVYKEMRTNIRAILSLKNKVDCQAVLCERVVSEDADDDLMEDVYNWVKTITMTSITSNHIEEIGGRLSQESDVMIAAVCENLRQVILILNDRMNV
jgi:hypothetical protein